MHIVIAIARGVNTGLEGLQAWRDGRVEGYQPLEAAVDAAHFYDRDGTITEADYQY